MPKVSDNIRSTSSPCEFPGHIIADEFVIGEDMACHLQYLYSLYSHWWADTYGLKEQYILPKDFYCSQLLILFDFSLRVCTGYTILLPVHLFFFHFSLIWIAFFLHFSLIPEQSRYYYISACSVFLSDHGKLKVVFGFLPFKEKQYTLSLSPLPFGLLVVL